MDRRFTRDGEGCSRRKVRRRGLFLAAAIGLMFVGTGSYVAHAEALDQGAGQPSVEGYGLGSPVMRVGQAVPLKPVKKSRRSKALSYFDHGDPTDCEQLMLELINRTRSAPAAEASRLGIDLNEGLPAGTISVDAKPPLAFHPLLIEAARGHSQWMLDTDTMSHTGVDGTDPGERMERAGYPFTGLWAWGENVAWKGSTGGIDEEAYTITLHENLFRSAGHRTNICEPILDEVGIGILSGVFTADGRDYSALTATQAYATSDGTPGPLLIGVVFNDHNDNGFYDIGEGVSGVDIFAVEGNWMTTTSSSGGYALPYPTGVDQMEIMFTGAPLPHDVSRQVTGTGKNLKLDVDMSAVRTDDYHDLVYQAAEGGTIQGETPQRVAHGAEGTAVSAVAKPGFSFANWSDGCTDNPRVDSNVTADLAVTANFTSRPHDADNNGDWQLHLSPELTRLIQLYTAGEYHISEGTEDGFAPGPGSRDGRPHDADINGDWIIQISPELTRMVQFYNAGGYHLAEDSEDGYAPGPDRSK